MEEVERPKCSQVRDVVPSPRGEICRCVIAGIGAFVALFVVGVPRDVVVAGKDPSEPARVRTAVIIP